MRNGSLKSVISFVVCGIMMALVTIATNLFTHQSHGVVYAEELTTYTSIDGKYTVSDTGVLTAYNGSEDMPSIPTKISVDTSSPSDGVADAEITVTAIGAGAFSGNTTITDVTLPSSVTHILSADTSNNGAFSGCTNLISVVTEDGAVTSIGDYAFYGCSMFYAISSGDFNLDMSKVTTIGMSAFEGCSIFQNIKLDSIETIGYKAFGGSENTSIQIAPNLQNIKYYSSNYPTPVNIETVSGDGEIIASGKIYTNNEKVLKYLQNINYANYSSMSINITGTDCAMIGEDITLNFAYSEAAKTKKLYRDSELLTDSLTSSYTDSISTAGKYIYKVEVTDVFGDIFEKTYTVVVLETDDFKDYTVVDGVLVKYNGTETVVTIPEYVDATYEYGHITSIGAGAFSGNTAITSVTLASSIDTIEDASYSTEGAFYGCTSLETVISTNDALKNIGKYAFYGCTSLETINANALVNIYDNAFLQCESLKTIGNVEGECNLTSLEYAGANMFIETAISGKIVLTSINKIGVSAFVNNGIEYLYIPENNDITYISDEYPSGVAIENAENGMFADNGRVYTQNEKVIAFLNRIGHTYITTTASFECADEMVVKGESITINNVVTTGDIALSKWYVNGVETAISQDNKITLNALGENVITLKVVDKFGDEVSATNTHTVRVVETDAYKYFVVEDGVLISYTGSDTEVVVPNYLDENLGYGQITTIGKGAFSNNSIIEKVTLSSGITAIENGVNNAGAFSNCYSLVEVVSENNALSVIGDYAFINSNMLEKVTASNVVTIGKYAFSGCASLHTIGVVENTIGLDSVTTIGVGAFMNNTFTGVVLKNVEVIGEYAFLSDSNYLNYLAIGNKENIVVLNEYNMRTAINESTSLIAKSTTKIYSVNEKVLAYATKNGLTYETLSVSITSDKEELVKGGDVTFSSTVTGLDIIYAWMNGGVSISGATSETYVDSSATATTKEISLKVTDVMGNEKVSNVIKVRYYSDNTYTLFEINEDGVLIKYHGTATNVIVPEYLDKDINDGRITSIGNGAFRENVTLVSVTLPASVTRIESATSASQGAFYGCSSLSQIIITNALVYVGDYACYGCNSLFRFGVSSDNNNFEYLTYVGISAFEGTNVTDVVLQNVTTIGENAFVDIGSGEYVVIDSNSSAIKVKTTSEEIGIASAEVRFTDKVIYTNNENVVTYATSNEYEYLTTSVVITGADKAVINEDVVLQANIVGVVESSSWTKGGAVIASNTSTVTVTSDVKGQVTYTYTITDMLGDTYSVDYVVRYYPDDKYIIFDVDENGVLVKYNGTLAVVEIPEYVYPDDETTKILAIGSGAFSGNVTITSVTIPSSVVEIKSATSSSLGAFSGCTNLETIIYTANLVDIGDYAFSGCVKLESLKVEDTHTVSHIKSVGVDAFFNTAVSNMYLTNVESIGYRAFVQCANLDKVVIGNYEDITFKKSNGEMVAISEATDRLCNAPIYTNNADVIAYARSVGVECIIPSVTIGKWVAVVDGEGNDISEANRVVDTSDIIAIINENVSIIAKVTALNPRYVWKVDGVTQNTLTTKDITHTMSVAGKKEYKLVVIDEIGNEISSNTLNVTYYASIEEYEFIVEDGVLVTYNGSDTVVEVPSVVGSNTITTIGKDAFNGNANITQLILGDTIKTIESADTFVEGAFYGCSALTQVVSKGNALENIGNYAFYGVESLQLISATNLKTIGNYALYNAKNLEQIGSTAKMYNLMQVTTLGINAIYANNKVESIYLDSLTTIGEYAIRSNTDLDIIYLGESVAFITYLNLQNAVVTENVSASATKTMLETISTANTKIYVYNNPELCEYFDVQAISYINTAITNLVYSDRVLVNTDSIFEVATTGLDVTYAWYKGDDDTVISAFDKVTINESVAGNYTYRLVVTDVVGNSIERELNVVIVENENELYFIVEDGVLVDYLGILTEVVVPTYKNGTDGEIWISVLGDAFKNNTKITKVVLGAGITEIMDDAFQGATSLNTLITTSSLTKVGNNVFNNLTKFELFTTDGSTNNFTNLTHIGDYAFANTKVDGVMLTNVESIGEGAFNGVESATIMVGNKDNIVITKSGAEAEDIATSNRMFTDKAIYSANPDLVQYASGKDITFTTLTVSISADKTLVAKDATVTISSITTGYGLSYTWYKDDVEIANETSDTLLTTSSVVGTNKYKLKVTDIMGGTCESDEVSVEYLINENYANFVVENGVLVSYVGSVTEVVVPDYLDVTNFDTAIHTISITAFRGNKNITSITFGANVRMVEGIEVLEDNSNINTAAFYGCTNLKEVEFLRLIDVIVGDYAFYNCGALESVVFDADSVVLGEYAFYNNTSLREVNSITDVTIDKYTFSGCVNLVQVGASSNVVKVANTTLPEYAFFRCEKVASFDLTQVEVIETCALNSCSGVTDLLLTNVTSIAANAIYINTSARVNIV
ncbi:MAG: leucine-rich repeat protein, partial [Clostridia bacterium]|nr:leucine-rich repeat protein [Clostridia bacterium]